MTNFDFIDNGDYVSICSNNEKLNLYTEDYKNFSNNLKLLFQDKIKKKKDIYNNRVWCISSSRITITPLIDDKFENLIIDLRKIKKNSIFFKNIIQIHKIDGQKYVEFYCENSQMPIRNIIHQLEYLKSYLKCHGYNIIGSIELYARPIIMSDKLCSIEITEDSCNLLYEQEVYNNFLNIKKLLKNSNEVVKRTNIRNKNVNISRTNNYKDNIRIELSM